MGDNLDLGDRNGVRTPMQWDSTANGGFSTADPASLYAPAISDPVYGYQAVNVEEQRKNPSSLLGWTRNMIGLRKLFSVFGRGTLRFLKPANRKVIAYLRQLGDESVLCVANLSRFAQPVLLDLPEYEGYTPMEVFGYAAFPSITAQPYSLSLAPYSFLWFELQAAAGTSAPHSSDAGSRPSQGSQAVPATRVPSPDVPAESPRPDLPALHPDVEVRDVAAGDVFLLHTVPAGRQELDQLAASLSQTWGESPSSLGITLAFPLREGEDNGSVQAELKRIAPRLRLAPYRAHTALDVSWPYPGSAYAELAGLAEEHNAFAVVHMGQADDPLPWPCILALANSVLDGETGLALAQYELSRYRGLLNSAALRPLARALYSAEIHYPLAPDAAYSRDFLHHLGSLAAPAGAGAGEEVILWPVLEAIDRSIPVAQVDVGVRHLAQPPNPDVTSLLSRILNSLFAVTERRATYWQKSRPLYPVRNLSAAEVRTSITDQTGIRAEDQPDPSPMLESFHLAAANLQEIWSQVMSPGTLLGIKRLAELPAAEFTMADSLWVRIVWDFLLAYRGRGVNLNHIFGALVPLYLAWAASYISEVAKLSDAEAEVRIATLALAFETDKPYLMARWRWPDRFAP
jgi:hypothetical protein